MSGNKLEDKIFFGEGYTLGHLPNLTILELDGNKFTKLPVEQIVLHDRLKRLSIENNQITKYSPELTEMVKLGEGLSLLEAQFTHQSLPTVTNTNHLEPIKTHYSIVFKQTFLFSFKIPKL